MKTRLLNRAFAASLLLVTLVWLLPISIQAQFDYVTNSGRITIVEYKGSDAVVTIPNTTNGLPVIRIGFGAFYGATMSSVTIPDNIGSIDAFAFDSCANLTNVTLGTGLTNIDTWAFYRCTGLPRVTIPNNVTRIRQGAFEYCLSLTEVYFQGNAPRLDAFVFYRSDNVTVFYLPGTTGWPSAMIDRPTAVWRLPEPVVLVFPPSFGLRSNRYGFTISWATNAEVVVEASAALTNPTWVRVGAQSLTNGWTYFSDPEETKYPARFYRVSGAPAHPTPASR